MLEVICTAALLSERVAAVRAGGRRIGVVPTMGALHAGHLSLVTHAQQLADWTVVTIFVNPAQFGPGEDLERYPQQLEADLESLRVHGVDAVFCPSVQEVYPPGFSTCVDPPAVARPWEGERRPGHFRGVATVVLKLLNLTAADIALFGQKDYQQSLVVRHMVSDLNLPVQVHVAPTVRDADGLALSSRNGYLDADQRQRALALVRGLRAIEREIHSGERDGYVLEGLLRQQLIDGGVDQIDYAAIADPQTLASMERVRLPAVALVAAYVGSTRLIDNLVIE